LAEAGCPVSAPDPKVGRTAVALLLLARSDPDAVDELLAALPPGELLDVGRWLTLVLSGRCGWSTETMATWRLKQELVS
jgi:hypothetical protein